MNPTPAELALIAAALAKNGEAPETKLRDAHNLWVESSLYLHGIRAADEERERIRKMEQEQRDSALIHFDEKLKRLMPKLAPGYRTKKFHTFCCEYIRDALKRCPGEPYDDATVERKVQWHENEYRQKGCPADDPPGSLFSDFGQWAEKKKHLAKSNAGRKGGIQKQKNILAKAEQKAAAREAKRRKQTMPKLTYVGDTAVLDAIAQNNQNLSE